jgi:hypothetical protein
MSRQVSLAKKSIVNFADLNKKGLANAGFRAVAVTYEKVANNSPKGLVNLRITEITTGSPTNNTIDYIGKPGLTMKTSSLADRSSQTDAITGFQLDRGVYRDWKFIGSKGSDSLYFESQGTIISNITSGVVNFGRDSARDIFTFTNTVDTTKHDKYNHLQKVKIINFGKEDVINLQGKVFGYSDVKNGQLPGVSSERLSISLIPDPLA